MAIRRYMDQRIKLQMLRVADAIHAHGSILKAAYALGVSQPALTKSLQELEDIVQARLFVRHSRGVRVTETGRRLIESGRKILAELSRLDEDLDLLADAERGSIAIGALQVAAAGVLPLALTRLKRIHPNIKIRLHQGRLEELTPLLMAGEIDLIVGRLYDPPIPDGLLREPLWSEPISLLARTDHPIFSASTSILEELRNYELILPTITQRVGQDIDHFVSMLGIDPTHSWRSNSQVFIREMLHGTDLIAVMPRLMMVGDLMRGTLKIVSVPVSAGERPAGLLLPPERALSGACGIFMECLRAYVAEIHAHEIAHITGCYIERETNDKTDPAPST